MKKALVILVILLTLQLSAQDKIHWETDYKVALSQAKAQNKFILVYVFDNSAIKDNANLERLFFSSDDFKNLLPKVILLKLDVSDALSYNARLGTHYLNKKSISGAVLVNQYNDKVGVPLTDFNATSSVNFISFLNSKL
jgi:hypothetical protein